ncbi:MAG: EAL domain-containing protein [Gammaproteobacteria bacterium]|nr:EAL domain-containing protein [Gammaproteobacteria bacterium]
MLMLLFVTLLLIAYAELRHRDFLDHHKALAAKATEGASRLISLYLQGKRRRLNLFVSEHHKLIESLVTNPEDDDRYLQLQAKVAEYFPDYMAFTVVDRQGELLVADFDGRIEEVCVNDLRGFAKQGRPQHIFIHPNPLGYHFDVMVRWEDLSVEDGILFISFLVQPLSQILADSELLAHQMMIIHQNIPGLIELTPRGSRIDLQREFMLSPQERSRAIYTREIPNTRWKLVDIPSERLIGSHRYRVRLQVLVVFVVFLSAVLYMAYLIRREERGRSRAEEGLLESHQLLEHKVKKRTRELSERNLRLIKEVTQRRKIQQALVVSEQRYALAVNGANDGIWDWNRSLRQLYLSPRCLIILGDQKIPEAEPKALLDRVHPDQRAWVKSLFVKLFDGRTGQLYQECHLRHASGHYRWFLIRGAVVRNASDKVNRMAGSLTDITKRKRTEQELLRDALHDKLTGLPNRTLFRDRLNQAIRSHERDQEYHFAVLYLDLDGFKRVNDSYGHAMGDKLLVAVAERIGALMRKEDTLARLSGDEFASLLNKIGGADDAEVLVQRILSQLDVAFLIGGREIYANASIGIALGVTTGQTADGLLRDADIAMYRAKAKGKGCYSFFDEQLRSDIIYRLNMETELRHAIDENHIVVYFQPIVSLKTGLIYGFEALVRWRHPQRGIIEPDEFIPIAEGSKLIFPLGAYVLREACQQMNSYQQYSGSPNPLTVSVNLSARQLLQDDLVLIIRNILDETGCCTEGMGLSLEVTETAVMENISRAGEVLNQLREMGIEICIDDFGTGHSSLSYLQNLPFSVLKIDRSLVSRMDANGKSAEIVRTIISLARNLGIKVVAEGIENDAQLLKLRELQCDYGQGYLFSKPKGAAASEELLVSQPTW